MSHRSDRDSDRYGSMMSGGGHHGLTGGHGELVLHILTGDLGDGVTVFYIDRNLLDLRVVHTVLSGDLTASMLHSSSDGVGHSMMDRGDMLCYSNVTSTCMSNTVSILRCQVKRISLSLSISISISLSLPLAMMIRSSITQSVHNLLAHLLILNLLGIHSLSAANFLRVSSTGLSDQDDIFLCTVGSRSSVVGDRVATIILGICLRISLGLGIRDRD